MPHPSFDLPLTKQGWTLKFGMLSVDDMLHPVESEQRRQALCIRYRIKETSTSAQGCNGP